MCGCEPLWGLFNLETSLRANRFLLPITSAHILVFSFTLCVWCIPQVVRVNPSHNDPSFSPATSKPPPGCTFFFHPFLFAFRVVALLRLSLRTHTRPHAAAAARSTDPGCGKTF